jgi:hypothetical protein
VTFAEHEPAPLRARCDIDGARGAPAPLDASVDSAAIDRGSPSTSRSTCSPVAVGEVATMRWSPASIVAVSQASVVASTGSPAMSADMSVVPRSSETAAPSIVSRSSRQPSATVAGSEAGAIASDRSSAIADGRVTSSADRRSRVVRCSAPETATVSTPSTRTGANVRRLQPSASGGGTSTVVVPASPVSSTCVMVEYVPAGWRTSSDSIEAMPGAVGTVSTAPVGAPNGEIHDVAGSPSVAAHPPAAGTPVSRASATVPRQPKSAASAASVPRRSSRTVA